MPKMKMRNIIYNQKLAALSSRLCRSICESRRGMARLSKLNAPSYGISLVSKKHWQAAYKNTSSTMTHKKSFAMLSSKTKSPSSITCYPHLIRNFAFITGPQKKAGLSHGVSMEKAIDFCFRTGGTAGSVVTTQIATVRFMSPRDIC